MSRERVTPQSQGKFLEAPVRGIITPPTTFAPTKATDSTETITAEDVRKATSPSTKMALALARTPGHTYEGTVPKAERDRRHAKAKAARKARKLHR